MLKNLEGPNVPDQVFVPLRSSPDCCLTHRLKSFSVTAFTTIGINAWFVPHNSAHWPRYTPSDSIFAQASLINPGIVSRLIPKVGTHHECMTSFEVNKNLIFLCMGTTNGWSTSNKYH